MDDAISDVDHVVALLLSLREEAVIACAAGESSIVVSYAHVGSEVIVQEEEPCTFAETMAKEIAKRSVPPTKLPDRVGE